MNDSIYKSVSIDSVDPATKTAYGFLWLNKEKVNGKLVDHVDREGDIFTDEATVQASEDYFMKGFPALESHKGDAVGKVSAPYAMTLEIAKETVSRSPDRTGLLIKVKTSDDDVFDRVVKGELKGFSVGGRADEYDVIHKSDDSKFGSLLEKAGKRSGRLIKKVTINEVSFCKRGMQDVGPRVVKSEDYENGIKDGSPRPSDTANDGEGDISKGDIKMPKLEDLQKQIEKMEKITAMNSDTKSYFDTLKDDDRDEFLNKSKEEQEELVKEYMSEEEKKKKKMKKTETSNSNSNSNAGEGSEAKEGGVSKSNSDSNDSDDEVETTLSDGTQIMKSDDPRLKKALMEIDAQKVLLKSQKIEKAVKQDMKDFAGKDEDKELIVKAILGDKLDEDEVEKAMKLLTKQNEVLAKSAGRQSTSHAGKESGSTKQELLKEWHEKADEMVEERGISKDKALEKVYRSNASHFSPLRGK